MEIKKKIIIVEDNDLYRAALADLINSQEQMEVVAETDSGAEAENIVSQFPADLIVLDLRLPGISGYDILPEISKSSSAKILVLTILESDHREAPDARHTLPEPVEPCTRSSHFVGFGP